MAQRRQHQLRRTDANGRHTGNSGLRAHTELRPSGRSPSTIRARSAQLQGKRLDNLSGAQLALVAPDSSSALDTTEAETAGIPKPLASLAPVDSSLQLDQLVNQGGIFTQSNLDLGKAHLLNTGGQLSSLNDLTLSAADLGTLGGTLWAEGTLTLTSEGDFTFTNQAKLDAGRGIVWDVKGAFTNQGSPSQWLEFDPKSRIL